MNEGTEAVVTFLLNSLWQVTVVFVIAQLGALLIRRSPARFRYRLWFGARLLAFLLPTVSTVCLVWSVRLFPSSVAPIYLPTVWFKVASTPSVPSVSLAPFWTYVLASFYLGFLMYRALQFGWRAYKAHELCVNSQQLSLPADAMIAFERCKSALNVGSVSLRSAKDLSGPVTVGIWAHHILIPEHLAKTATDSDWTSILSHEIAHVRRNDFTINLISELASLPLSFHPATIRMKTQLERAREIACDELAIDRCIAPHTYARSLVRLAEKICKVAAKAAPDFTLGIFDANILEERIMKLVRPHRHLSTLKSATFLALLLAALMATCISASTFAIGVGQVKSNTSASTLNGQQENVARIGPGITPPHSISTPNPQYPSAERDKKRSGTVELWCVIGTDGLVRDARVVKSLSPDFDNASLETVRQWKFQPAEKDGKPIAVQVNVETTFKSH